MSMTIMGGKTPRAIIQKSESHKLHHAFTVKSSKTIYKGQLVVLETDGSIRAYESTDTTDKIIGVAVTDSVNPAYAASKQNELEVTVALNGHMIIYGVNKTSGALNAGPVKPDGTRKDIYDYYVAHNNIETVETSKKVMKEPVVAINLTPATAKDQMIKVLIL